MAVGVSSGFSLVLQFLLYLELGHSAETRLVGDVGEGRFCGFEKNILSLSFLVPLSDRSVLQFLLYLEPRLSAEDGEVGDVGEVGSCGFEEKISSVFSLSLQFVLNLDPNGSTNDEAVGDEIEGDSWGFAAKISSPFSLLLWSNCSTLWFLLYLELGRSVRDRCVGSPELLVEGVSMDSLSE